MLSGSIAETPSELRHLMRRFFSVRSYRVAKEDDPISALRLSGLQCYLFGGAIRDVAVAGPHVRPRDLDIVVGGTSIVELHDLLGRWVVRRTRFGGLRLQTRSEVFDVWPAQDTWAFQQFPLLGSDPEELPRTTPFTVESVVVALGTRGSGGRKIYEHGFLKAMAERTIELNFGYHMSDALTVVRALAMARKLDFGLSPGLVSHLAALAKGLSPPELFEVSLSHYGPRGPSEHELAVFVGRVVGHHRWHKRVPLHVPRTVQTRFGFAKPTEVF